MSFRAPDGWKWRRHYETVEIVRRRMLGHGGAVEHVVIGRYRNARWYRRSVVLVELGASPAISPALGFAVLGMLRHREGTREHLRHARWAERLLATQRVLAGIAARERREAAEAATGRPYRDPGGNVVVLHAPRRPYREPTPAAATGDGPEPPDAA